jgi:hypothetical protein
MATAPFNYITGPSARTAFQMPSAALHDLSDPSIAKGFIGAKGAFLHRTLEFPLKAFHQPIDLEMHPRVHDGVEVPTGMLQGQGVRIRQKRRDIKVKLGRKVHQVDSLWRGHFFNIHVIRHHHYVPPRS